MPLRYLNKREQEYVPSYTPLEPSHLMRTAENITAQNDLGLQRWGAFEESHLNALTGANEEEKASINEMYESVTRQFQPAIQAGNYRALGYQVPRMSKEFAANVMPIRQAIGERQGLQTRVRSVKNQGNALHQAALDRVNQHSADNPVDVAIPDKIVGIEKAVPYAKEMGQNILSTLQVTNEEAYNDLPPELKNDFNIPAAIKKISIEDITEALIPVLMQDSELKASWEYEAWAFGRDPQEYIREKAAETARAAAGLKAEEQITVGQFEALKEATGGRATQIENILTGQRARIRVRPAEDGLNSLTKLENKVREETIGIETNLKKVNDDLQTIIDSYGITADKLIRESASGSYELTDEALKGPFANNYEVHRIVGEMNGLLHKSRQLETQVNSVYNAAQQDLRQIGLGTKYQYTINNNDGRINFKTSSEALDYYIHNIGSNVQPINLSENSTVADWQFPEIPEGETLEGVFGNPQAMRDLYQGRIDRFNEVVTNLQPGQIARNVPDVSRGRPEATTNLYKDLDGNFFTFSSLDITPEEMGRRAHTDVNTQYEQRKNERAREASSIFDMDANVHFLNTEKHPQAKEAKTLMENGSIFSGTSSLGDLLNIDGELVDPNNIDTTVQPNFMGLVFNGPDNTPAFVVQVKEGGGNYENLFYRGEYVDTFVENNMPKDQRRAMLVNTIHGKLASEKTVGEGRYKTLLTPTFMRTSGITGIDGQLLIDGNVELTHTKTQNSDGNYYNIYKFEHPSFKNAISAPSLDMAFEMFLREITNVES